MTDFHQLRVISGTLRKQETKWLSEGDASSTVKPVLIDIGSGLGAGIKHMVGLFSKIMFVEPNDECLESLIERVSQYGLSGIAEVRHAKFPFDDWSSVVKAFAGSTPYVVTMHWSLLQNHVNDYEPFTTLLLGASKASVIFNDLAQKSLVRLPGMTERNMPKQGDPRARVILADAHKQTYHICETEYLFHPEFVDTLRSGGRNVAVYRVSDEFNSPALVTPSTLVVSSLRALRMCDIGAILPRDVGYLRRCCLPTGMVATCYLSSSDDPEEASFMTGYDHDNMEYGRKVPHVHSCQDCGCIQRHCHARKPLSKKTNSIMFSNRCTGCQLKFAATSEGAYEASLKQEVLAHPDLQEPGGDAQAYWARVGAYLDSRLATRRPVHALVREKSGIAVATGVFSASECAEVVALIGSLPCKLEGKRRVFESGRCTYGKRTDKSDKSAWVTEFAREALRRIGDDSPVVNCRLVDYVSHSGSGVHIDRWEMGSTVYGLTLSSHGVLRFTTESGEIKRDVSTATGDIYSFSAVSRYDWFHEYHPRFADHGGDRRVVLTIRTDAQPPYHSLAAKGYTGDVLVRCVRPTAGPLCERFIRVPRKLTHEIWQCKPCQLKAHSTIVDVHECDDSDSDLALDGYYSPGDDDIDVPLTRHGAAPDTSPLTSFYDSLLIS